MNIKTKRIYEKPTAEDGLRILVDRLWPRGITKKAASIDFWFKEIAPGNDLRKWFAHDPLKWQTFKDRYLSELKGNAALKELLGVIMAKTTAGTFTFVYAAKSLENNNAVALKEFISDTIAKN
jgi:uncharacterized protein YeaO (DUF488 family)